MEEKFTIKYIYDLITKELGKIMTVLSILCIISISIGLQNNITNNTFFIILVLSELVLITTLIDNYKKQKYLSKIRNILRKTYNLKAKTILLDNYGENNCKKYPNLEENLPFLTSQKENLFFSDNNVYSEDTRKIINISESTQKSYDILIENTSREKSKDNQLPIEDQLLPQEKHEINRLDYYTHVLFKKEHKEKIQKKIRHNRRVAKLGVFIKRPFRSPKKLDVSKCPLSKNRSIFRIRLTSEDYDFSLKPLKSEEIIIKLDKTVCYSKFLKKEEDTITRILPLGIFDFSLKLHFQNNKKRIKLKRKKVFEMPSKKLFELMNKTNTDKLIKKLCKTRNNEIKSQNINLHENKGYYYLTPEIKAFKAYCLVIKKEK